MRKNILITLLIFFVLAGIEVYRIHRSRTEVAPAPKAERNENFSADDYVSPHKINAFDLEGARSALLGKTVWVKAGNYATYYPYSGSADFKHEVGLLPPLEKLAIKKITTQTSPGPGVDLGGGVRVHEDAVLAVFTKADSPKTYAVAIGTKRGGDTHLILDDLFFAEDPHQLYSHWPKEIWDAVDHHDVINGMNELQSSFSLGGTVLSAGNDYGNRTVTYANAGHPVTVTFEKNHAVKVEKK